MSRLYLIAGGALLIAYVGIETRGMVFSGTDTKPSIYYEQGRGGGSGSGGGGGVFFWGSGYRGGK